LNCGSSSIKYKLYEMDDGTREEVVDGLLERIGRPPSRHKQSWKKGRAFEEEGQVHDHRDGLETILESLKTNSPQEGIVEAIDAVGHRVVHGGAGVTGSILVDDSVMEVLHSHSHLAPLHNPPNIAGIEACRAAMPKAKQTVVFDNALHHDLPNYVYTYALPLELARKHGVRRYGFHGIAFLSAVERAEEMTGERAEDKKVVTLMLGSGCTANAYLHGRSVEVSTGFTPLEGLVQSTRSGDLDAAAVLYLMEREGMSPQQMGEVLNRESGLLGISGVSADMRDIEKSAGEGREQAQLAVDVFVHRARKYLGAYSAAMGGIDWLLFAGGIGVNCPAVRAGICRELEFMGIILDEAFNQSLVGKEGDVSADGSRVKVFVTRIDEELVIARDTFCLVQEKL
jgi:acetate kinase